MPPSKTASRSGDVSVFLIARLPDRWESARGVSGSYLGWYCAAAVVWAITNTAAMPSVVPARSAGFPGAFRPPGRRHGRADTWKPFLAGGVPTGLRL